MKNKIIVLFLFISVHMQSHMAFGQALATVKGTAEVAVFPKVYLYKIELGKLKELATSGPNEQGQFALSFIPPYDGLYALGAAESNNLANIFLFYFQAGDILNVDLKRTTYQLQEKNTMENKTLAQWYDMTLPLRERYIYRMHSSTYVDYFPLVEELNGKRNGFVKANKSKKSSFNTLLPKLVDYDMAYLSVGYLYTPRPAHPSKEEMTDYYLTLKPEQLLTKDLFLFPYAEQMINPLIFQKVDVSKRPAFDDMLAAIPEREIQGEYVVRHLAGQRTYIGFLAAMDKYKDYLVLADQRKRAERIGLALPETKVGAPAVKFGYPDRQGKMISLDDIKGKLVLIDLWATWCGPCRSEEPHWEKLNQAYEGKGIVFIGISVDKDKGAWEKYLDNKKLEGLQLYAGPENELSKAYKVNGIPRYMLFDQQGNVISADAPRPSNSELPSLIDAYLKK